MDEFAKMFKITLTSEGSVGSQIAGALLSYILTVASFSFVAFCIAASIKAGLS